MTRRQGIITMLATACGMMTGRATYAEDKMTIETVSGITSVATFKPLSVNFNLGGYERFEFILGDEKVSLTPIEIMAALKSAH